jgi:23S rRNA (guanosine2251-2'-O)-methyltransferase
VVGFHAVLAAIGHQAERVELVLVQQGGGGGRTDRVLEAAKRVGVRWQLVPRARLDELARDVAHNGFAARLAPAPLADAEELLALPAPVCLVGLDGVEDVHNLGAVIRTAAALALGGVVVAGPHPPPLGGAAAKVAAGALPLVPVAHVGSLGDYARRARDAGFWVYGAGRGGEPVAGVDLPERLLLCLGAEASGLRSKTRAFLDGLLAIPIAPGVESLNLSVAAAILAWEWRRRYPG